MIAYSARAIRDRVMQKEVRDVLTDQILFGALEHGGTASIDIRRQPSDIRQPVHSP